MRDVKRDPALVRAEMKLEREVRSNKASIDRQEAQAMAVDVPKKHGDFQLAQLNDPDDRTDFADMGEGCLMAGGNSDMYKSHTEQGNYARGYTYKWDFPKSIAPCDDSGSDYDY